MAGNFFRTAHPHTLTDIRLTLLTQTDIFWEKLIITNISLYVWQKTSCTMDQNRYSMRFAKNRNISGKSPVLYGNARIQHLDPAASGPPALVLCARLPASSPDVQVHLWTKIGNEPWESSRAKSIPQTCRGPSLCINAKFKENMIF